MSKYAKTKESTPEEVSKEQAAKAAAEKAAGIAGKLDTAEEIIDRGIETLQSVKAAFRKTRADLG